jgi:hypothetical protein
LGLFVAGLAAEQLTPHWKARLVFWRWRDPLPGCEAFTRWIKADPRIDAAALERKFGPFPTVPAEQNARWYGMYQSVADHPAVSHTHRLFLLGRDYAAIAALIAASLGPAGFWIVPSTSTALIYEVLLLAQYLFARQAARNSGIEFVCTVLALKSHE